MLFNAASNHLIGHFIRKYLLDYKFQFFHFMDVFQTDILGLTFYQGMNEKMCNVLQLLS